MNSVVGTTFGGRWKIERPLASGGMGAVFVATHGDTGRRVALKLIKDDGAKNPELVARFRKETGALAAVSHPNVVTFLDSGVDDASGTFFLVMELLEGRALRSVMTSPLEWKRAFKIGADICRALSAVHKAGIIHRDLKPENVFLQDAEGHDEIAKLIDFGIVRLHDRQSATMTKSGAVVGTPGYIAPEQLQGQDASTASDVYAVGVILYELVTGKFPFEAPTPHAMLVRQLIEPLIPPRTALSSVPLHVENVILRFMDRDPAARVKTAKEALAVLIEAISFIDSLPPSAPTELGAEISDAAKRVMEFHTPAAPPAPLATPLAAAPQKSTPQKSTAPTGTLLPPVSSLPPAPRAPTSEVAPGAASGVAPKKRSAGEIILLCAGIALLGTLGTCTMCVGAGVLKNCGSADSSNTGDTGDTGDTHDSAGADSDVNAPSGPPIPPVPPVPSIGAHASVKKGADGKGQLDLKLGDNAHFTLHGLDLDPNDLAALERGENVVLSKPPPVELLKAAVQQDAEDFADCGGSPKPVPLKLRLTRDGIFHLDNKATTPALQCAADIVDELDGPEFKGKPVSFTLPMALGR